MEPGKAVRIKGIDNPLISIIIPSMRDESSLSPLLEDIENQTVDSIEIIVAYRISPSGRARNMGMNIAQGKYLLLFDDDIRLGNKDIIRNLIYALESGENIGLSGASIQLPPDSSSFQKRIGREIPRLVFPILDELTDSDMVTTMCWAQKKENWELVGPFNEELFRGVDPEYRKRVREKGFRVVIAPNTWTYHPAPKNLQSFLTTSYRNGYSSAYAQKFFPELVAPVPDSGKSEELTEKSFIVRVFNSLFTILSSIIRLRYLSILERISYSFGYIAGYFSKTQK